MLVSHRTFVVRAICIALLTLPVLSTSAATIDAADSADALDAADAADAAAADASLAAATAASVQEAPLEPVAVAASGRPLTIAMLMPADGSPFTAAAKIVGNGLMAASKTSPRPATILLVESPASATIDEQLDAAIANGADVVVGPLERNAVEALASRQDVPLPVVALNIVPSLAETASPNLIMMSVSTDVEARYIAQLAVKALPPMTQSGEPPKILILTTGKPWENRLRDIYEAVLRTEGVGFDVILVDEDKLTDLQKQLEPKLSAEASEHFAKLRAEIMKETAGDVRTRRSKLRSLDARRRAAVATGDPPYQAALLTLDAQTASLVRNRLPRLMRVWGTSASNPGDPRTSSASSALTYDLDNLVFCESPLIVRYDTASFEARFETAMPYSLAAKRLFALGADAYEIAQQWSTNRQIIQYHGETGQLSLDRKASALVNRTPQTIIVKGGYLIEVPEKQASQTKLPKINPPKPIEVTPRVPVDEVFTDVRRTNVKELVVDPQLEEPLPTPPIKPLPQPASAPAAEQAAPGLPLPDEAKEPAP